MLTFLFVKLLRYTAEPGVAENPALSAHPRYKLFKVSALLSGKDFARIKVVRDVSVKHNSLSVVGFLCGVFLPS